jgi:hypothetical protein
MSEWFLLITFKKFYHKVFIFHILINHNGVSGKKVKVTGALNVRMVSAYYLKNYVSESLDMSHIDWS